MKSTVKAKPKSLNPPRGKQTAPTSRLGVASNPRTSEPVRPAQASPKPPGRASKKPAKLSKVSFNLSQADEFGYKLASLPVAVKDKELFAALVAEELGIPDVDRFYREVHRTDVPTPKT